MMTRQKMARAGLTVFTFTVLLNPSHVLAATKMLVPDLTKGETHGTDERGVDYNVDRTQNWNLGPTGMRGWIYTKAASHLDNLQNRFSDRSRQILVTDVGPNTPASGVMKVDDVIIGIDGKRFTSDARKAFGAAITEAEKEQNKGIMRLLVWRDGMELEVELKLQVMGTYSETAPYDCPKSQRILRVACAKLTEEPLRGQFGPVSALALMATGNPEYMDKVRSYVRSIHLKGPLHQPGMISWLWGYNALVLCEYYLLTGDKAVLPEVEKHVVYLAKRQGKYGTFGHGGSGLTYDGELHGAVPPYGPVNAIGIICNMAIVLGQKCGIRHPEIEPAIERGAGFFSYYAGKGAIPYGEHMPWIVHGANGKTTSVTVLFNILGNERPQYQDVAKTFAMMSTAAYQNRQNGHTGQGLNYTWGGPGVNCGGPLALGAWFNKSAWHFDLVRRCDGSFTYDGAEQYGPGKKKGDESKYWGPGSTYYGLNPTACHVLTYSVPKRNLYITGRGMKIHNWLTADEVEKAIRSGRMDDDRKTMTVGQLMEALNDWSPIARKWVAEELASRPEARQLIPKLMAIAEGSLPNARQGACMTLGNLRATEALPIQVRLLRHEDRWLRVLAAEAIRKMGGRARPHLEDMLRVIIDHDTPLSPVDWKDPIAFAQGALAETVFSGSLLGGSMDGVDKRLLYKTVEVISRSPSGRVRQRLVRVYASKLSEQDVETLAPAIVDSVRYMAPADTMFGTEIRMAGVALLVKYKYKEGIPVLLELAMTLPGHGSQVRIPQLMKMLRAYGKHARVGIPQLRDLIKKLDQDVAERRFPGGAIHRKRTDAVEEAIKFLQQTGDAPALKALPAMPERARPE